MKTFRMIGMALMAVLMCVNFTSCSEDDDTTDNGGGNAVTNGNRITKVVSASEDWVETRTYSYDNNGRLVEAIEIDEHDGGSRTRTYQFVWSDNTILVNYEEESAPRSSYTDSYIITLENGLVQSISDNDGNSNVLIYNGNKLAEIVDRSTVVWNGDKVKSISDTGEGWTCTFSYDKSYKGYSPFFLGALDFSFDAILFEAHPEIIGMQTSQLPTSINIDGKKTTYEYEFDKDGNITNIIGKAEDGSTTTCSTTWNTNDDEIIVEEKKLTKIVCESVDEYGTDTETYTFSYDNKGRLFETTHREYKDDDPHTKQYVWEDTIIKVYSIESWNDNTARLRSTFTIKDGLVQYYEREDEYRDIFTYNSSNRFISSTHVETYDDYDNFIDAAVWDGDKLISASRESRDYCTTSTLTYGKTCKKGYYPFIIDIISATEDENLFIAHPEIGGMDTKQLPTKRDRVDTEYSNEEYYRYSYEYEFDKDGYISKIYEHREKSDDIGNNYNRDCTYTLTWE